MASELILHSLFDHIRDFPTSVVVVSYSDRLRQTEGGGKVDAISRSSEYLRPPHHEFLTPNSLDNDAQGYHNNQRISPLTPPTWLS